MQSDQREAKQDAELRRAKEVQQDLKAKLVEAEAGRKERTRSIEGVLKQIPNLERQLASLRSEIERKDIALDAREREFEAMKLELQRREHRLIQAEKMTSLLENARRDVKQLNTGQQRDMHYNMALVYAKEGKYREAENEYLHSLRLDPTDAEAHYNLGILLDDELNDKSRAAMHYKKYLQLNPHGADAEAVRGWLLQLEMQLK